MSQHCVIVGTSHAAANLSAQLRNGGWEGEITIVGEEPHLPYHRPPLSKAFLSGEKQAGEILIRPQAFYDKARVGFHLGQQAVGIDTESRELLLADGERIAYDKLALTTGAAVRHLRIPGADLDGVYYLRDLADASVIRDALSRARRAVVIGGGYIGLEAAASLRAVGLEVTVLEAMPRILQRVTSEEMSEFYTRVHREEGVEIVTDARVESLTGDGSVAAVHLADGSVLDCELVIIGVGVIPQTELAESAGLTVDNGIVVDEYARSSDPHIVAAGDCTWHFNPLYERWLRLESVQNATDQARCAANTLNGKLMPYRALPWFWSDQYDIKLQIAGLSEGFDRVVLRGSSAAGRSFSAFYLQGERLLAMDAVNRPREHMAIRKALAAGPRTVDARRLADESADLTSAFAD